MESKLILFIVQKNKISIPPVSHEMVKISTCTAIQISNV